MKPIGVTSYTIFTTCPLPEDAFCLLRPYPTDLLILRLSVINSFLFNDNEKKFKTQKAILRNCFPQISLEKKRRVTNVLNEAMGTKDIAFFTAPTTSRLISLCLQNYKPNPEENDPVNLSKLEDDLLDSLFIQNQLYYNREPDDQDLNTYEAIWRLQLLQQQYIRSHSDLIFLSPIKNVLFYKFMMCHFPNGPMYLQEFCQSLGIPAYFNYLMSFKDILQKIIESSQQGETKHILDLDTSQRKVIESFAIKPESLPESPFKGNVHAELMTHPFYFVMNRHAVIIDPHFFRYVIDISLPFQVHKLSSLHKLPRYKRFEDFKGELGKKYYEEFIVKQVLENIFHAKNYTVFNAPENSPLSDFTVVRNQRQILMIEVKSSAIHYNPLEQVNLEELRQHIDSEFCQEKTNNKTKNKGVYQLVQQLNDFAKTTKLDCVLKDPAKKKKATIFPVLVYTEDVMDMAGINAYLNGKFEEKTDSCLKSFRRVLPLVTINLNFFLLHYAELKKEPQLLFELLSEYTKEVAEKNKRFTKHQHPKLFFEKNSSFEQFANKKLKEKNVDQSFSAFVADFELIAA